MPTAVAVKLRLIKFAEEKIRNMDTRKELSRLIASYVAESIREDRKKRSLFGSIFGDRQ